MTTTDWAFFWHRRYFYNHIRLLWYIGQIPAWQSMIDNWLNKKISKLNQGE